ncbi:MAG: Clp protease N-terminal domain-containing protein [Planctomycetota bacterium]
MFERFTDRARKIMAYANQEAMGAGYGLIDPGHILLGLIREGTGVGLNVLKNLGLDLHKALQDILTHLPPLKHQDMIGKLPQSGGAKKVLEFAIEEGRNLNHNYVGSEHLLLGLLRTKDSVAAEVLANQGIKIELVREEVINFLGSGTESGSTTNPTRDSLGSTGPSVNEATEDALVNSLLVRFDQQIAQLVAQKDTTIAAADYERAAHVRDMILVLTDHKCWIIRRLIELRLPEEEISGGDWSERLDRMLRVFLAALIEASPDLRTEFADVVLRLRTPPL